MNSSPFLLVSLGQVSPDKGPAVNAPKLSNEATQLCSSFVRTKVGALAFKFENSEFNVSWGNVGADHERTVPRPNDPIVATRVAENQIIRLYQGCRKGRTNFYIVCLSRVCTSMNSLINSKKYLIINEPKIWVFLLGFLVLISSLVIVMIAGIATDMLQILNQQINCFNT